MPIPAGSMIMLKSHCPDCHLGKVPHNEENKYFDYKYCSTCDGTGWVQNWTSINDLYIETNKINAVYMSQK